MFQAVFLWSSLLFLGFLRKLPRVNCPHCSCQREELQSTERKFSVYWFGMVMLPTFGFTLSSSPFSTLQRRFSHLSFRMLKFRQCRGAKYWFHVSVYCKFSRIQSPKKITSGSFSRHSDRKRLWIDIHRLSPSTSLAWVAIEQGFICIVKPRALFCNCFLYFYFFWFSGYGRIGRVALLWPDW